MFGFLATITAVLFLLKLAGVIDPWLAVFAPLGTYIFVIFLLFCFAVRR